MDAANAIRQPSKLMSGSIKTADIRTGLVIGIHKKELDFGKQVAAFLSRTDIRIVQIDHGLPQQESFDGKGYYYSTFHREIYLQLHQQVKNKLDLLIDLHTGIDESGRCADIFCSDMHLLARLKKTLSKSTLRRAGDALSVRLVEIARASYKGHTLSGFPICHTIIPRAVWKSAKYSYVGLEIYLKESGKGKKYDWEYGAGLVESIVKARSGAIQRNAENGK